MRDAATQDRRRNERAKMLIFREIAKWKRWRHAPWLMATAVITDSHHRFSKRWHVADVKNIAGDDQTILMVHWNSANFACTFRIYVCLRLCDRDCCSAAEGSGSCHAPAPSYFEEMTRCRRQILQWRWPGNPNGRSNFRNLGLLTFTRSQQMPRGGSAADGGFQRSRKRPTSKTADVKNIVGDDQDRSKFRKYANLRLRDQAKRLEKLLFAATNDAAIDGIAHRLVLSLETAFVFTFKK